jgi:ribosome maturation protein SDO1
MRPDMIFDTERVHFNVAKMKKGGENFEVVIDPDKAVEYKEGKKIDIAEVLKAEKVFFDAKRGEHASEERMQELFGSADALEVAEIIIKEGEIQLTAEHRAKVREEKRKRVVQLIARNACDPKTKLPHPILRIENAMEEAKIKIDEFKRPEDQLQHIIKELRPILPISIETRVLMITISAQHATKAYSSLHSFGVMKRESWQNDGSWIGHLEVPAGMVTDLIDKLNAMTHGSVHVEFEK